MRRTNLRHFEGYRLGFSLLQFSRVSFHKSVRASLSFPPLKVSPFSLFRSFPFSPFILLHYFSIQPISSNFLQFAFLFSIRFSFSATILPNYRFFISCLDSFFCLCLWVIAYFESKIKQQRLSLCRSEGCRFFWIAKGLIEMRTVTNLIIPHISPLNLSLKVLVLSCVGYEVELLCI